MQSLILVCILSLVALFISAEYTRNNYSSKNNYASFRADNVAANIIQFNDVMTQYVIKNYDSFHEILTSNPENVELISVIDYADKKIYENYSQKNLQPFLNYRSATFNYTRFMIGESQLSPTLYLTTSWDNYENNIISYKNIKMLEILGKLGHELNKRLYQGNSTYWTVPWVFSQANCNVIEVYSYIPDDSFGNTTLDKFKNIFNKFCNQIQANSNYRFLTYVYLQPVYKPNSL
jgi:hypothetical protein